VPVTGVSANLEITDAISSSGYIQPITGFQLTEELGEVQSSQSGNAQVNGVENSILFYSPMIDGDAASPSSLNTIVGAHNRLSSPDILGETGEIDFDPLSNETRLSITGLQSETGVTFGNVIFPVPLASDSGRSFTTSLGSVTPSVSAPLASLALQSLSLLALDNTSVIKVLSGFTSRTQRGSVTVVLSATISAEGFEATTSLLPLANTPVTPVVTGVSSPCEFNDWFTIIGYRPRVSMYFGLTGETDGTANRVAQIVLPSVEAPSEVNSLANEVVIQPLVGLQGQSELGFFRAVIGFTQPVSGVQGTHEVGSLVSTGGGTGFPPTVLATGEAGSLTADGIEQAFVVGREHSVLLNTDISVTAGCSTTVSGFESSINVGNVGFNAPAVVSGPIKGFSVEVFQGSITLHGNAITVIVEDGPYESTLSLGDITPVWGLPVVSAGLTIETEEDLVATGFKFDFAAIAHLYDRKRSNGATDTSRKVYATVPARVLHPAMTKVQKVPQGTFKVIAPENGNKKLAA
jgi:hypothetical protein